MRKDPLIEGEYYHIYNRGTDKRKVFLDSKDYQRFQFLLYLCNSADRIRLSDISKNPKNIFSYEKGEPIVSVHAYSLMPNHFHLLIQAKKGDHSIALFMQKVTTAYTMYFNKLNNRTGSLFQGTYKSSHVGVGRYMQYLFAYIHANPFSVVSEKNELHISNIQKVMNYQYSSILDYRNIERPECSIVDKTFFDEFCNDDESIEEYLKAWLTYHQKD